MSDETDRVFGVLLANRASVEKGLEVLVKKAARKGLAWTLSWSWGKAVTKKEIVPHPEYGWEVECRRNVTRIPLTLHGETPHFAGWHFLAALEHLDGANILRGVSGEEIPAEFRTRGPACDHCKVSRRRNDTYVLRHEGHGKKPRRLQGSEANDPVSVQGRRGRSEGRLIPVPTRGPSGLCVAAGAVERRDHG
jgi:hypothetical protein